MLDVSDDVEVSSGLDVLSGRPSPITARSPEPELRAVVAIPVCDEADRIGACLLALAGQSGPEAGRFAVVVFVNNSQDTTLDVINALEPSLPYRVRVLVDAEIRPPNAGWARRVAMEAGAAWLAETPNLRRSRLVLLTTDADTIVPVDWVSRNLDMIDAGYGAVAGAIALDPCEADNLPASLRARGRLEGRYEALLMELTSRLSPVTHDPWPRHWTTSGASLAVELQAYREAGGMPELARGEDRAFVAALVAAGARVRHEPAIMVVTSGRLIGRAIGGAADTMRLRAEQPDAPCDERLQTVIRTVVQIVWPGLGLAPVSLRPRDLPLQIAFARPIVAWLRLRDRLRLRAARPGGIPASGSSVKDRQPSLLSG